jgi:hypothetical protein
VVARLASIRVPAASLEAEPPQAASSAKKPQAVAAINSFEVFMRLPSGKSGIFNSVGAKLAHFKCKYQYRQEKLVALLAPANCGT